MTMHLVGFIEGDLGSVMILRNDEGTKMIVACEIPVVLNLSLSLHIILLYFSLLSLDGHPCVTPIFCMILIILFFISNQHQSTET